MDRSHITCHLCQSVLLRESAGKVYVSFYAVCNFGSFASGDCCCWVPSYGVFRFEAEDNRSRNNYTAFTGCILYRHHTLEQEN